MRELLLAGRRRVHEVLLAEDLEEAAILAEIVDLAGERRVPVRQIGRRRLDAEARTDAPQGVVARAAPLPEADLDDLLGSRAGPPFLLVVDGVTDPGNLGALLRSAEGAGVTGVLLPRHRAVHVSPAVTKAAAGAIEHLPIALVGGVPSAMERLAAAGVWTIGLDPDGGTSLWDLELATEPVALVVGAEGRGLARLTRKRCDQVASIPLSGHLASLNAAVAGAVACFEVARRRGASTSPY